jgi:hypothetical protein
MGKVWFLPKHFIELGGDPNQSLFEDEGSEVSNADPEAQGVKAAPGGGE